MTGGGGGILEELPQGFDELQALAVNHPLGKTADVVVGCPEVSNRGGSKGSKCKRTLDGDRGTLVGDGLDHIYPC